MGQPDRPPALDAAATRRRGGAFRGLRVTRTGLGILAGAGQKVAGRVIFWAPVWLPLVLVIQLALVGLKPAQAEERRLDRVEAEVSERVNALLDERDALLADSRRLGDGVWQERVRRSLRNSGMEPLILESSRAGAGPQAKR